jgi:hypothetical protein
MKQELKATILDVSTGKVIEREFTSEEAIEYEAHQAANLAKEEASEAVRNSALAKLAALGLTEEEIAAL